VLIGLKTGSGLGSLDILLDTILKLWVSLYRWEPFNRSR